MLYGKHRTKTVPYVCVQNIPYDGFYKIEYCGILSYRCTVAVILKGLSASATALFHQRGQVDYIVMVDWESSVGDLRPHATLSSLKDAIYKVRKITRGWGYSHKFSTWSGGLYSDGRLGKFC